MSPSSTLTLGAILFALFLVMVAALVWQEGKRRQGKQALVYGVEEAVDFINARLAEAVRERLRRAGVQRIIEWEVFYLQGLAQEDRRRPIEAVAGGIDPVVDWVSERLATVNKVQYREDDIRAVLALEADYLVSIGAVGNPVEEDE
jgi:hypothetical protein